MAQDLLRPASARADAMELGHSAVKCDSGVSVRGTGCQPVSGASPLVHHRSDLCVLCAFARSSFYAVDIRSTQRGVIGPRPSTHAKCPVDDLSKSSIVGHSSRYTTQAVPSETSVRMSKLQTQADSLYYYVPKSSRPATICGAGP